MHNQGCLFLLDLIKNHEYDKTISAICNINQTITIIMKPDSKIWPPLNYENQIILNILNLAELADLKVIKMTDCIIFDTNRKTD